MKKDSLQISRGWKSCLHPAITLSVFKFIFTLQIKKNTGSLKRFTYWRLKELFLNQMKHEDYSRIGNRRLHLTQCFRYIEENFLIKDRCKITYSDETFYSLIKAHLFHRCNSKWSAAIHFAGNMLSILLRRSITLTFSGQMNWNKLLKVSWASNYFRALSNVCNSVHRKL